MTDSSKPWTPSQPLPASPRGPNDRWEREAQAARLGELDSGWGDPWREARETAFILGTLVVATISVIVWWRRDSREKRWSDAHR